MMAQLAYGKIAFLAGTALLTAKIALVLSAIIGLKKLVSHQGGGAHEVIDPNTMEAMEAVDTVEVGRGLSTVLLPPLE